MIKTGCCAGAAALLGLCVTGALAQGQNPSGTAYDRMIEGICRQYAVALPGLPAASTFNQCMRERHCYAVPGATGYHCDPPGPEVWHGGGL